MKRWGILFQRSLYPLGAVELIMKMRVCSFVAGLCVLVLQLVVVPRAAQAGDFSKKIPAGSSYADVMGIWGEPIEKVEEGILKQTIWYYTDGAKVVFKNGRVRSFRSTNAVIAQQAALEEARVPAQTATAELAGETRDLVRDIAKEVPSGPDVPFAEPPGPGQAAAVPNQMPSINRGVAPAILPADDGLEDQD
jgi:hypothetical protein